MLAGGRVACTLTDRGGRRRLSSARRQRHPGSVTAYARPLTAGSLRTGHAPPNEDHHAGEQRGGDARRDDGEDAGVWLRHGECGGVATHVGVNRDRPVVRDHHDHEPYRDTGEQPRREVAPQGLHARTVAPRGDEPAPPTQVLGPSSWPLLRCKQRVSTGVRTASRLPSSRIGHAATDTQPAVKPGGLPLAGWLLARWRRPEQADDLSPFDKGE